MDQKPSLLKSYDAGISPFSRDPKRQSSETKKSLQKLLHSVDIKALIHNSEASEIIPTIPPRDLYLAIRQNGITESMEVLNHLSTEQFVRFCDYDTWQQDQLVPKEVLQWVSVYKHLSPEKMYQRFRSLDEEYQTATLSPFIRIYDSTEYEAFDADRQDRLYRFPGEELFYEVLSDDEEIQGAIEDLISLSMGEDMAYAMSLVSHSGYAVPLEAEHLLSQFRKARLEEDGFVSDEEARTAFYPLKPSEISQLKNRWGMASDASYGLSLVNDTSSEELFLLKVLRQAKESLTPDEQASWIQSAVHLNNCLAAITQLEPDDLNGMELLMEHSAGLLSLALEELSNKNPQTGCFIIQKEHPKTLFRYALTLIRSKQEQMIQKFEGVVPASSLEKLRSYWQMQKFSMIQDWFDHHVDVFGLQQTEKMKAFFNRFPMVLDDAQTETSKLFFRPIHTERDYSWNQ